MRKLPHRIALILTIGLMVPGTSRLEAQTIAAALDSSLAPHRSAMGLLKSLDGSWRGSGWTILPSGEKTSFSQTIRVGGMGEGAVKVLEGRTYGPQGQLTTTNFEIISYDVRTSGYTLRVYSEGKVADVAIVPADGGFTLEYQAGDARVRFSTTVANGTWTEAAERRTAGGEAVRFLELVLHRVSDTEWPAAGALPPR